LCCAAATWNSQHVQHKQQQQHQHHSLLKELYGCIESLISITRSLHRRRRRSLLLFVTKGIVNVNECKQYFNGKSLEIYERFKAQEKQIHLD